MAPSDYSAQFQEPPVSFLPARTASDASKTPDISMQFQEPISPQNSSDVSKGSKSTAEKLREKIKKPFVKEKEVKSPELVAAEEALQDKGML